MRHLKSGAQVAHQIRRTAGKNDARYWLPRLFHKRNDRGEASPHYSMRVQFRGRRMAFSLGTGNKDAAARLAAKLYGELLANGIDAVLAKHRSHKQEKPQEAPTIGAWIAAASKVFDRKPATFGGYARALRFIASEILGSAKNKKRYGRTHAKGYRKGIEGAPLSILTPEAIQSWKIRYAQKAGENPLRQRSARITCNSNLRQAKALFSRKILKFVSGVSLPDPLPFAGVELYPRETMRYQSKLDVEILLKSASAELSESDPEAFKALILALGAGLRRGEIDRLLWRQVDFNTGVIHVETTEAGGLKSSDSAGDVPIGQALCSVVRVFRAKSHGQYVLEEGTGSTASRPWGQRYRCGDVFDRLIRWLREQGVEGAKPLHTLRKEAGSIIATKAGIFAASRFLRHADMQVTSMHYADHKERVTVDMDALSPQANTIDFATRPQEPETTRRADRRWMGNMKSKTSTQMMPPRIIPPHVLSSDEDEG